MEGEGGEESPAFGDVWCEWDEVEGLIFYRRGFDVVWRLVGRKGGKAVNRGVGDLCRKAFELHGDDQRGPSPHRSLV